MSRLSFSNPIIHDRERYIKAKRQLKTTDKMFDAASQNRVDVLKTFTIQEFNQTIDEAGNTILHIACAKGCVDVLRFLHKMTPKFDFIAQLSTRNSKHYTPTNLALIEGHVVVLDWIFTNYKIQARNELSYTQLGTPTLLSMAIMISDNHVLNLLIDHMEMYCISIDETNVDNQTSLHQAAYHGKLDSCQTLINRGANALLRDSSGNTAAQISEARNFTQVASYLVVVETCIRLANQVVTLRENLQRTEERNSSLMSLVHREMNKTQNSVSHTLSDQQMYGGSRKQSSFSSSGVDDKTSRKSSRENQIDCVNVSFRSEPASRVDDFKDKLEQVSNKLLNSSIL